MKQLLSSWFIEREIPFTKVDSPIFLDGPDPSAFPGIKCTLSSSGFEYEKPNGVERWGEPRIVSIRIFDNEKIAYRKLRHLENIFVYDNPPLPRDPAEANQSSEKVFVRIAYGPFRKPMRFS